MRHQFKYKKNNQRKTKLPKNTILIVLKRSQVDPQNVLLPPTIVGSSNSETRQSLKAMNSSRLRSRSQSKTEISSVSAIICIKTFLN